MTTRRGFLAAALAACAAPAYVKAGILMPVKKIVVPTSGIQIGIDWGIRDSTAIWETWFDGEHVRYREIPYAEFYEGPAWTPDQLATMPRRQPLVFNQISVTDWPKVAAAQDEKNRRLTRVLAGLP